MPSLCSAASHGERFFSARFREAEEDFFAIEIIVLELGPAQAPAATMKKNRWVALAERREPSPATGLRS